MVAMANENYYSAKSPNNILVIYVHMYIEIGMHKKERKKEYMKK